MPLLRGLRLPSHASGNAGGEDEQENTLRVSRRTERADTLHSSTMPTLELPENLKTWSPTYQSAYLSSTLCGAGAGEVPDQLTRDIIASAKKKQITEKTFLRLNEGALEGYVFLFSLILPFLSFFFIYVTGYIFLIIGLDLKVRTANNTPHPPLCASRSQRQNMV